MNGNKEKLFSTKLFLQGLKRTKNTAIGEAVCFIVINALWAFSEVSSEASSRPDYLNYPPEIASGGLLLPIALAVIPMAFLLANVTFSFIRRRKEADFYHALPQKRICVYTSFLASCAAWLTLIITTSFFVNVLIFKSSDCFIVPMNQALLVLAGTLIATFTALGVGLVCNMLSGTNVAFWLYTLLIYFIPRVLVYMFFNIVSDSNLSIVSNNLLINLFTADNTPVFLFFSPTENSITAWESISQPLLLSAISFLEIVAYFVLAAFLYCKRESQLAGAPIAYKKIHAFFRLLVTLPLVFLTTSLIYSDAEEISVFIIGFAIIIHFLFELIVSKKPKAALKSTPWFMLTVGVSVVLFFSAKGVSTAYVITNPTSERISSISFSPYTTDNFFEYIDYNDYRSIKKYYNLSTNDQEAINAVVEDLDKSISREKGLNESKYRFKVSFTLKNGKKVFRTVRLTEENYVTLLTGIRSEEEHKKIFSPPAWEEVVESSYRFDGYASSNIHKEIYLTFVEEYNALSRRSHVELETGLFETSGELTVTSSERTYEFYLSRYLFPDTLDMMATIFKYNQYNNP